MLHPFQDNNKLRASLQTPKTMDQQESTSKSETTADNNISILNTGNSMKQVDDDWPATDQSCSEYDPWYITVTVPPDECIHDKNDIYGKASNKLFLYSNKRDPLRSTSRYE